LHGIAGIRQQQQTWGRRALSLFVAVWLNLALQPCAMAYESDDEAPMQMQGHGGMHHDMGEPEPCADSLSDCFIDDDLNNDGRNGQLKLKDLSNDLPLAIVDCDSQLQRKRSLDVPLPARYGSLHSGAPPPLYVLHCVYLK
jgi:hypothetical protein